jgi:hypothetical protein
MAGEADTILAQTEQAPSGTSTGSVSSGSFTSYSITSKEDARAAFRKSMTEMYGFYDPKLFNSFYAETVKLQKRYGTRRSGEVQTDYTFNVSSFMDEYLQALAPSIIKTGKYGGMARQTVDELSSYADNMGLNYGGTVFAKDMQTILSGERTVQDIFNSYRESAMSLYPNFAKRLQENAKITLKDLASPYVNTMASLLEMDPSTISISNPVLQGALSTKDGAIKPVSEFVKDIKNMDAWKYTNNAKEEAVSLASSFKRSFGFGG